MSQVTNSRACCREATSHGRGATPTPRAIHAATRRPAGAARSSIPGRQAGAPRRAEIGQVRGLSGEECAGGGGAEGEDETGEALGEPGERQTGPKEEGREGAGAAARDEDEAEQRGREPEHEQGIGGEEPPVLERARRGREDARRQGRRRRAEERHAPEEGHGAGGDG